MPKILPVTKLKPQLLRIVTMAEKTGQEYIITKNGKPAAIIMSYDDWESWKETMEILADQKLMASIRRSVKYFARGGKGKTIEEVFGKS